MDFAEQKHNKLKIECRSQLENPKNSIEPFSEPATAESPMPW